MFRGPLGGPKSSSAVTKITFESIFACYRVIKSKRLKLVIFSIISFQIHWWFVLKKIFIQTARGRTQNEPFSKRGKLHLLQELKKDAHVLLQLDLICSPFPNKAPRSPCLQFDHQAENKAVYTTPLHSWLRGEKSAIVSARAETYSFWNFYMRFIISHFQFFAP